MRTLRERRRTHGFTDIGKVRIPPLPQYIVMTDRADGTRWLLTQNTTDFPTTDGLGYISITDVIPPTPDVQVYGPCEGPYARAPNVGSQAFPVIRLLIRSGFLGYEQISIKGLQQITNARVLTRQGLVPIFREIIVPSTWKAVPDLLGWTVA